MKKLFMHVGMSKTGTTFIQQILHDNIEALRQEDIHYINFSSSVRIMRESKIPDCTSFFKKIDSITKDGDSILISNEFLHGFECNSKLHILPADKIALAISTGVKGLDFDTNIIIYIRRIDLWLESLYAQCLANGASWTFNEFLEKMTLDEWNLYKQIKDFADVFGNDKIIVKIYDQKYLPEKNSLLNDFADIINSKSLKSIDITKYSHINQGMNRLSLEIAKICNRDVFDYQHTIEIKKRLEYFSLNNKPMYKKIFFTDTSRKKLLKSHKQFEYKIKEEFCPNHQQKLFSSYSFLEPDFKEISIEDVMRVLMFSSLTPNSYDKYNHLLTLRTLHILYKLESAFKKIFIIKRFSSFILKSFKVRDW